MTKRSECRNSIHYSTSTPTWRVSEKFRCSTSFLMVFILFHVSFFNRDVQDQTANSQTLTNYYYSESLGGLQALEGKSQVVFPSLINFSNYASNQLSQFLHKPIIKFVSHRGRQDNQSMVLRQVKVSIKQLMLLARNFALSPI